MMSAPADSRVGEGLRQTGKITRRAVKTSSPNPRRAQPGFGFRKLDRIGVQSQQPSAGQDAGQKFLRVSAEAQRAIHRDLRRVAA